MPSETAKLYLSHLLSVSLSKLKLTPYLDSIEILESGDSRLDQFRDADGKLYFYDLQAARHSSYSVEGLLVHNCSMVGEEMAIDLLSFKKPILVLGDPGQLPPIKGEGYFTQAKPDVFLSEIHRQAEDSAIIRLATMAREGRYIPLGKHSETVWKIDRNQIGAKGLLRADQVICGFNATRLMLNNELKKAAGFTEPLPIGGEKIICLKNQNDSGLINGQFLELSDIGERLGKSFRATIKTEDGQDIGRQTLYCGHFDDHVEFDKERSQKDYFDKKGKVECVWGYAITGHKSQGSGWNNVAIFDDGFGRGDDRHKWLYTCITRAVEGLVILE